MSTSDVADARAEALRDRAARRSFHRGILTGGTAGAVIVLAGALFYPSFSHWLNERTSEQSSNNNRQNGQLPRGEESEPSAEAGDSEREANPNEEASPNKLVSNPTQSDDASLDRGQQTAGDAAIRELREQFRMLRDDLTARLAQIESSQDSPNSEQPGATSDMAQLQSTLLDRLDEIDAKVSQYDQVAERFTAFYSSELPELRRTVNDFPKTELRLDGDQLDDSLEPTPASEEGDGVLILNNTTGVAGYVYVNERPVWLKLGQNEINAPRDEIVIRIPNGGTSYRLDAGLWRQDSDGRYVMNRPSWPPTAP